MFNTLFASFYNTDGGLWGTRVLSWRIKTVVNESDKFLVNPELVQDLVL